MISNANIETKETNLEARSVKSTEAQEVFKTIQRMRHSQGQVMRIESVRALADVGYLDQAADKREDHV